MALPKGDTQNIPVKKFTRRGDELVMEDKPAKPKRSIKERLRMRDAFLYNILLSILVPVVTLVTTEWIARGTLGAHKQGNGFFQALSAHFPSFFLALVLLMAVYIFVSQLSGSHLLATVLTGLLGVVPAIVTYYKLTLRGEPFLPWDLTQIEDLMGVSGSLEFSIPVSVYVTAGIFLVLGVAAAFVKLPTGEAGGPDWMSRLVAAGASLVCVLGLLFGIFLNPAGTKAMGIREDSWMQDRYYRTNGVITGFLTNLQLLNISAPEGYSQDAVLALAEETDNGGPSQPVYAGSFAATGGEVVQPDIIYLMAESFWDVTALDGIEYDQAIIPNLTRLAKEGAYGKLYSPSFGGGTCDVEFEALTGFSMEYLPAGSKPYQQYVTDDMFSLPWYLKSDGYQTMAIHGYGRKFWSRQTAYPRLGIDEFIASEDFVDPDKKRGFISDDAMVDRIIEEYEGRKADTPMFIHAVTMQNHTTYNRNRYPADQLVKVTESPAGLKDSIVGQLEDCATGIRDMDAALGRLCDYLRDSERPTIVVFWGDHMNPMSDGYSLFETTGFIEKGDTTAPQLHETPLLVWSNFSTDQVDLGTIAAYNLSPVVMDLYGLEKPQYFDFLTGQLDVLHGRTRGITIRTDDTHSEEMTEAEQASHDKQAILQYDYMFGDRLLESYTGAAP